MRINKLYIRGTKDKRILQWKAVLICNKQHSYWGCNNINIKDRRRNPYVLNLIQDYQFLQSKVEVWWVGVLKITQKGAKVSSSAISKGVDTWFWSQSTKSSAIYSITIEYWRYVAFETKFYNRIECIWRSVDCTQESRFIMYKFQGSNS